MSINLEGESCTHEKLLEKLLKNLLAALEQEADTSSQVSIAMDEAYDYLEATR